MSKIEKLKLKIFSKPTRNDITMEEIERLARYYGCTLLTGGNHQIRVVHKESGTIIPIPQHGKCVKEAYMIELRELFQLIENMNIQGRLTIKSQVEK